MIMQTRLLRAAAAGLGLLLSASVVQPSLAADDIVFGFSVAMSGPLAAYDDNSTKMAQVFIDDVNAKGGLLGRKIKAVFADTMKKPDQGFDVNDPANVAPFVAWLASSEARGVTGRIWEVTGGRISLMDGFREEARADAGRRWDPAEIGAHAQKILAEARRKHASGRTSTDNYEIKFSCRVWDSVDHIFSYADIAHRKSP